MKLKAVLVTHNETSTGIKSRVEEIRKVIDEANHPALFMVDTSLHWARTIMNIKNGKLMLL